MLLNKDSIKKYVKRKEKVVEFPEFSVKILSMTIEHQIEIEDINKKKTKDGDLFYPVIQFCCVDENNNPLFETVEDVKNLPGDFASKLFAECMKLSTLNPGDMD